MNNILSPPQHRLVKKIAVVCTAVLFATVTLTPTAFAQKMTSYTDVPEGAWYESSAATLLVTGALDANRSRLEPAQMATRAEVVKMLIDV